MHFDPKKYIKNYKMRFIQNKEDMISYHQLKKMGKKSRGGPKIGQSGKKCIFLGQNAYNNNFLPNFLNFSHF